MSAMKSGLTGDGCHISISGNGIHCGNEHWSYSSATKMLHGPGMRIMCGIPDIEATFYAVAGAHGGLQWSH